MSSTKIKEIHENLLNNLHFIITAGDPISMREYGKINQQIKLIEKTADVLLTLDSILKANNNFVEVDSGEPIQTNITLQ